MIDIKCLPFSELSLYELYAIMVLRQEIFVVEQDCPYVDADGKDPKGFHLMFWMDNELVAYTRLLPAGISYKEYTSIGRVVNSSRVRGQGMGKKLMEESIKQCLKLFPNHDIKISAQVYLDRFYTELGFLEIGDRYDEDGIPHMGMIFKK
ncbi:GNAT family N-acetyltransferase [Saprospiraceae bacterium]|nr:GNAT family N-acetyltransferase [Saprospiraceae bacterium]